MTVAVNRLHARQLVNLDSNPGHFNFKIFIGASTSPHKVKGWETAQQRKELLLKYLVRVQG